MFLNVCFPVFHRHKSLKLHKNDPEKSEQELVCFKEKEKDYLKPPECLWIPEEKSTEKGLMKRRQDSET